MSNAGGYLVVVHSGADPEGGAASGYGVTVPDLPGCCSEGDTLAEAVTNAGEAVSLYVEDCLLVGDPVPSPATRVDAPPGAIVALVPVTLAPGDRSRRLDITMPDRLISIIDGAARRAGMSRSGWLAAAAVRVLTSDRVRADGAGE